MRELSVASILRFLLNLDIEDWHAFRCELYVVSQRQESAAGMARVSALVVGQKRAMVQRVVLNDPLLSMV